MPFFVRSLAYKDSPAPVKYSEIVENSVPNNVSPLLEPKEKEYMKMCTVQQQSHIKQYEQLKQGYPDAMKQAYDANLQQYVPKEPVLPPYPQKESHLHPYQQYYSKYNVHCPRNYPGHGQPETNNFLATLSQINPRMAQSIMNDHHIRESQVGMYPNVDQTRGYQQRLYHPQPSMRTSPNYAAPSHRGVPQAYNYPQQFSYKQQEAYNRMAQYQLPPKYENYKINPQMEQPPRSMSPRRSYHENMAMPPANYAPVPQKASPTYPQCAQLEYSRHYQHRRMPVGSEYYQQGYKPYMQPHQLPPENPETAAVASNSIKQFLENWVEEDVNGTLPDIVMSSNGTDPEKIQLVKGPVRIKEDGTQEQYYVLGSTEISHDNLPQYVHVQQVEKLPENIRGFYENGLPINEASRIIIKGPEVESVASNVEIIASGSVNGTDRINIIENRRLVPGHADKVVNLHIVEAEGEDLAAVPKDARVSSSAMPIPQEAGNLACKSEVFAQQETTSPKSLPVLSDINDDAHLVPKVVQPLQELFAEKIVGEKEEQKLDTHSEAEKCSETVTLETEIGVESASTNNSDNTLKPENSLAIVDSTCGDMEIKNNNSEDNINKVSAVEDQELSGDKEVISYPEKSVVEEANEENLPVCDVIHSNIDTSDSCAAKEETEEGQSEQPSLNIHSETNDAESISNTLKTPSNNNNNSDTKDATNHSTKTDEFDSFSENKHSEIPAAEGSVINHEELSFATDDNFAETVPDDTKHSNDDNPDHKTQNRAEVPVIVSPKIIENVDTEFSKAQEVDHEVHTTHKEEEDEKCVIKENVQVQNEVAESLNTEKAEYKEEVDNETSNIEKPDNDVEVENLANVAHNNEESMSYVSDGHENEKCTEKAAEIIEDKEEGQKETEGTKEIVDDHQQEASADPPHGIHELEEDTVSRDEDVLENEKDIIENQISSNAIEQEGIVEINQQNEGTVIRDENEVMYRSALKIDNNNVLLQIDDELVEISVENIDGKKFITVIPFTGATVIDQYNNKGTETEVDELKISSDLAPEVVEGNVQEVEERLEDNSVEQVQEIEELVEEVLEESKSMKHEDVLENCDLLVLEHNEVVVECEEIKEVEEGNNSVCEKDAVLSTIDQPEIVEELVLNKGKVQNEEELPPILERMDIPAAGQLTEIVNQKEPVLSIVEQQPNLPKLLTKASRKHFSDENMNVDDKRKETYAQKISHDLRHAKRTINAQRKPVKKEKPLLTKPTPTDANLEKTEKNPLNLKPKVMILKVKKLQHEESEEGKNKKKKSPPKKVRFEENERDLNSGTRKIKENRDKNATTKETKLKDAASVEEDKNNLNFGIKNIKEVRDKAAISVGTNVEDTVEKNISNLSCSAKKIKENKDKTIFGKQTKVEDAGVEENESNLNFGIKKIIEVKDKSSSSKETECENTKLEENVNNLNSTVKKIKENKDKTITTKNIKNEDARVEENGNNLNSGTKKIKEIKDKKIGGNEKKVEDVKMDKQVAVQNNGVSKSLVDENKNENSEKQNEPVSISKTDLFEDENLEPKKKLFKESSSISDTISTPKQQPHTSEGHREKQPPKFAAFESNSSVKRPIEHKTYENSQKRRLSLQEYNRRKKRTHQNPEQPKAASASPSKVPSTESREFPSVASEIVKYSCEKRTIDLPKTVSYRNTTIDADEFDIPTKTEEDDFNHIRTSRSLSFPMGNDVKSVKDEIDKKLSSIELQIPKTPKANQSPQKSSPQKVTQENDLLMRRFLNRENLTPEEVQKVREIITCKRVMEEINKAKMLKQITKDNMDYKHLNQNLKTSESDAKRGVYEVKRQQNDPRAIEHFDANRNLKLHLKKVPGNASVRKKRRRFRNLYTEQSSESDVSTETTTNDVESAEDNSEHNYRVYQSKVKNGLPTIIIKRKLPPAMQPYVKLERSPCIDMLAKRRKVF